MATYMCGFLRDHITGEEIREAAYRKGREDQGELNAETVREIRELVYQQGIEKGRADAIAEISREMRVLYGNDYEKQIRADVIAEISNEIDRLNLQGGGIDDLKFFLEQLKEQK